MLWKFLGILLVILILLYVYTMYNDKKTVKGILFTGNIDYSDMNSPIEKMYVVSCPLGLIDFTNIFTHAVSHHGILCFLKNNQYIVSRVQNTVQVMEVKKLNDYGCEDIEGFKYNVLQAFNVEGLRMSDLLETGKKICDKHTYFIFGHNCQEFVYDILEHYQVLSTSNTTIYQGGKKLLMQGLSEIVNRKNHA